MDAPSVAAVAGGVPRMFGGSMTIKKEFQQAVKDIEKSSLKKPTSTSKPVSLKKKMSRIVEGADPEYHLR